LVRCFALGKPQRSSLKLKGIEKSPELDIDTASRTQWDPPLLWKSDFANHCCIYDSMIQFFLTILSLHKICADQSSQITMWLSPKKCSQVKAFVQEELGNTIFKALVADVQTVSACASSA
jgi:hypothetical protein